MDRHTFNGNLPAPHQTPHNDHKKQQLDKNAMLIPEEEVDDLLLFEFESSRHVEQHMLQNQKKYSGGNHGNGGILEWGHKFTY